MKRQGPDHSRTLPDPGNPARSSGLNSSEPPVDPGYLTISKHKDVYGVIRCINSYLNSNSKKSMIKQEFLHHIHQYLSSSLEPTKKGSNTNTREGFPPVY